MEMNKAEAIEKIKNMSAAEFEEFSEEFHDWLKNKFHHEEFLKYLERYNNDLSMISLKLAIENFLISRECKIDKLIANPTSIYVIFKRPPPMNNTVSFDFSDYSTFVRKYN